MLDVTYIFSTFTNTTDPKLYKYDCYPSTTRVMTNILNNQKNLNVIYSDITLKIMLAYIKYFEIEKDENNFTEFHYFFCNEFIKNIETKFVLLTLNNPWEILFTKYLLDHGKKVVVGGAYTKIYTCDELRQILKDHDTKNLKNLVIVRPYIDKHTDIYKIITDWEDISIIDSDSTIIFETNNDYFLDQTKYLEQNGIKWNNLAFMTSTKCRWKKCSFCKFYTAKENCFLKRENIDNIVDHTICILDKYNVRDLAIGNPEFYFTKLDQLFLNKLFIKRPDFKITFFCSIRQLLNDKYLDFIFNEYKYNISNLLIGLETLDASSLKLLNKGTTVYDAFKVAKKIIKRNKELETPINAANLCMSNLSTVGEKFVKDGYEKLLLMKRMYQEENMPVTFSFSKLKINPLALYSQFPFINIKGKSMQVLREYKRTDIAGKILQEDKDIVDSDVYNELVPTTRY